MIVDAIELIFNDVDFSCLDIVEFDTAYPSQAKSICGNTKSYPEVCPEVLEDIRTD
jgi:hypothetical protein